VLDIWDFAPGSADGIMRTAGEAALHILRLPPCEQSDALAELRAKNAVLGILAADAIAADMLSPLVMLGKPRSIKWPSVARQHLIDNPRCAGCGSEELLQVHHIRSYHEHPDLELDRENLITLCMKYRCHLCIGHLCSWYSINEDVVRDAAAFLRKVKKSP
jgi:5-methylcytosine-specific restriction enzyme A